MGHRAGSNVTILDENAECLAELAQRGVDLSVARDVDFSHIFVDETGARGFAARTSDLGYTTRIEEPQSERIEWDVTATVSMVPTCENITASEQSLADIAALCGGSPDGWGFLTDERQRPST